MILAATETKKTLKAILFGLVSLTVYLGLLTSVFTGSVFAAAIFECKDGTDIDITVDIDTTRTQIIERGRSLCGDKGFEPSNDKLDAVEKVIEDCKTGKEPKSCIEAWNRGGVTTYTVTNDCEGPIRANVPKGEPGHCGILNYFVIFINVLSALAGVVIVGSIVGGGIQYSMAGSDPQKVQAAKNRIRNAIIALLFFLFGYGLLNYLVPGGVL